MILQNKRVVITGAGGGLGQTVSLVAAEQGAELILLDLRFPDPLPAGLESARTVALDLCDLAACQQCFAGLGQIDAVFNLAGGFAMGVPTHAEDDAQWDEMFKLNVSTLRNVLKAVVPVLQKQGHGKIVNVGAMGALQGNAMMSAYSASKSVVMRLTESLSGELREQGINVNAVLPSVIDTPRNRADMPDADPAKWVAPRDLANVICFLGSENASAVHGALLPVSGLS